MAQGELGLSTSNSVAADCAPIETPQSAENVTWRDEMRAYAALLVGPLIVTAAMALMEQRRGTRFDLGDRSWQGQASCLGVDPDLFFPERGASTREAKGICHGCVVREDCLEYALVNSEKFGIWGGLSERERRRVQRQRSLGRITGVTGSR
jgi:WhiB family redox-sensing transcriptional regulator